MNKLRKIKANIVVPSSKSMTQRAIAAATLAKGKSIIRNYSLCDDCLAALDVATALGAQIIEEENNLQITGNFHLKNSQLNCRESAFCARLFSPIVALQSLPAEIVGSGTLLRRSMKDVINSLNAFGVKVFSSEEKNNFLPLKIEGILKNTCATIDASQSSQVLSGLLMSLPLLKNDSEIIVENLASRPYIDMTLEVMKTFGVSVENENYKKFSIKGNQCYTPQTYAVEGDWSSAAFWLVSAAISGNLTLTNLRADSLQADKAILKVLEQVGAIIEWKENAITVQSDTRNPFHFNASDCPDLFPPLVLLATFCDGNSIIEGVNRLQQKESNRALALQETFGKFGVPIEIINNTMIVQGGKSLHGATVSSFHDHRIAMAVACVGLFTEEQVNIIDADCVKKSYPKFFDDFKKLQQ